MSTQYISFIIHKCKQYDFTYNSINGFFPISKSHFRILNISENRGRHCFFHAQLDTLLLTDVRLSRNDAPSVLKFNHEMMLWATL